MRSAESQRLDLPIYDSAQRRWLVLEELLLLVKYRDLVSQLVARNIKIRYKRSVLGVGWTMLNPLMTMTVLAFVFSYIFQSSVQNYPIYVISGLIFWTFFAQTTVSIVNSLMWGENLFNRIYFPRTTFAVAALGTGLVNLLLCCVPLFVIVVAFGVPLSTALFMLPLSLLLIAMFALGVGLFLSILAIEFADVVEIYQVLLTAWMYLTPIIYPIDIIPAESRWVFNLNPIYHLLLVFRDPIHPGLAPPPTTIMTAIVVALGTLIGGWWFFTRKADEIAYRV
jgi:ABC-2 type transport system permease protein